MQNSALVPWDERLYIVLDLDQTLVYTPTDGEEFPGNVRLNIQDIVADGTAMKTAIRPFALEMLEQLESMFTVFVITGGTPSYCSAIVDLLNRLAAGKDGTRQVIKHGVSCRSTMVPVQAQPKTFHLVLPDPHDHRFALAIDNCVAKGTQIPLLSGVSVPIENVKKGMQIESFMKPLPPIGSYDTTPGRTVCPTGLTASDAFVRGTTMDE
jgi:hypothetical protein